jgi:hypothetical protein
MKITIEAEPKEIAALVLEIQGRRDATTNIFCSEKEIGRPLTWGDLPLNLTDVTCKN